LLDPTVPTLIAWTTAAIFAAGAFVHLAGFGFVQRAYERWNFRPKFYRITGVLELLTALFLAMPITRIWGVALGGFVTFAAIVVLLNNRQYAYTLPGILILIALPPAALAGPF
jgi:hypothetical protein